MEVIKGGGNINNKAKKELAEKLFIEDGLTAKEISTMVGISEQTLSRWRKEGNWENKRNEFLAAPHKIKEVLMKELKGIASGEGSKIDADALAKVSKVIETLSSRTSVQVIFSVFKEFDNWMADQEPQLAIQFIEWHKRFLQYRINQEE
ncbi:helix-turn-helix domain-containing protein [Empedobacter brevis]|uniref:helix-turn-helix domain-containing protein n=1 Tax=Empedobacter brevis TaxID=247 RepID=UPI00289EDE47|nr:helix-turn-helix domain-containing protein [Empedobacter brevis]